MLHCLGTANMSFEISRQLYAFLSSLALISQNHTHTHSQYASLRGMACNMEDKEEEDCRIHMLILHTTAEHTCISNFQVRKYKSKKKGERCEV